MAKHWNEGLAEGEDRCEDRKRNETIKKRNKKKSVVKVKKDECKIGKWMRKCAEKRNNSETKNSKKLFKRKKDKQRITM